jgi:hypothetical protein
MLRVFDFPPPPLFPRSPQSRSSFYFAGGRVRWRPISRRARSSRAVKGLCSRSSSQRSSVDPDVLRRSAASAGSARRSFTTTKRAAGGASRADRGCFWGQAAVSFLGGEVPGRRSALELRQRKAPQAPSNVGCSQRGRRAQSRSSNRCGDGQDESASCVARWCARHRGRRGRRDPSAAGTERSLGTFIAALLLHDVP